jgi:hypothetical protein
VRKSTVGRTLSIVLSFCALAPFPATAVASPIFVRGAPALDGFTLHNASLWTPVAASTVGNAARTAAKTASNPISTLTASLTKQLHSLTALVSKVRKALGVMRTLTGLVSKFRKVLGLS